MNSARAGISGHLDRRVSGDINDPGGRPPPSGHRACRSRMWLG